MKKIVSYILACMMMLTVMAVPSYDTYAANISLSVSASSVNIGDTVTATVSVPSGITATVDVYFSTDLFSFVSASGTTNVNGGTVATTLGDPFSSSVTIKLKAKTTGTASISASAIKAGDNNTGDVVTLGGASKSVTIANKTVEDPNTGNAGNGNTGNSEQPETPKSGDNSLSSLKISTGSLSPAFKYNVTKYTATVDYDVTKLVVSAKTSNEKATIESVTGNGNVSLQVGENTIKVVVKAENGVQATYTIVVTRKEKEEQTPPSENPSSEKPDNSQNSETPDEPQDSENSEQPQDTQTEEQTFEYNGQKLNIIEEIPTEAIPADFVKETILIEGKETPGLKFSKGELQALYLANESGYGSLYVYDKSEENIYPLIKLISEKKYVIILRPDDGAVPKGFEPCTLSIEGKGTVFAYRYEQESEDITESTQTTGIFGAETYFAAEPKQSDFYLIYCVNSDGEYGWYQFDSIEGTFQRYLATMDLSGDTVDADAEPENNYQTEITALKNKQKIMLGIFAVVVLVLLSVIMSLVASKRKLTQKYEKSYVYEEDNQPSEELQEAPEEHEVIFPETQAVSSLEERIEMCETSENEETDDGNDAFDMSEEILKEDLNEDEVEVEFFDMAKENAEESMDELEDEAKVEFLDMSEEIMEEVAADLKDEVAFLDVSKTNVQEIGSAESEDEMEIEFFDMSEEAETEKVGIELLEISEESITEDVVQEVEVEFFDMSEESVVEDGQSEFINMSKENADETVAQLEEELQMKVLEKSAESEKDTDAEKDFKLNLEKQLAATDKKQTNQSDSDDDNDLEFIDL